MFEEARSLIRQIMIEQYLFEGEMIFYGLVIFAVLSFIGWILHKLTLAANKHLDFLGSDFMDKSKDVNIYTYISKEERRRNLNNGWIPNYEDESSIKIETEDTIYNPNKELSAILDQIQILESSKENTVSKYAKIAKLKNQRKIIEGELRSKGNIL